MAYDPYDPNQFFAPERRIRDVFVALFPKPCVVRMSADGIVFNVSVGPHRFTYTRVSYNTMDTFECPSAATISMPRFSDADGLVPTTEDNHHDH